MRVLDLTSPPHGDPMPLGSALHAASTAGARPIGPLGVEPSAGWPLVLRDVASTFAEPMRGWRQHLPRNGKAMAASFVVHASIFAALMVSFNVEMPKKPEMRTMEVFTVSTSPGEGLDVAIPKTSAPEPVKQSKPDPKPVEDPEPQPEPKPQPDPEPQPEPERPQPSSAAPATAESTASANPGGGMIWTPPAPKPNASGIDASSDRVEKRVEMPKVDLPKGASEPVLLSYDQGRYSDAAAMSEASRLMNNGTITMAVTVDTKGAVGDCIVTTTSGSRMLDERACLLVRSYAYRPAQDNAGKTHGALVTEVLEWARDGKFSQPSDAKLEAIRKAEGAMPRTGSDGAGAMPKVSMPQR
jgi:protein TonB